MSSNRDWREYERQIFERLKKMAGEDAEVEFDVKLPGRMSGVSRQLDAVVKTTLPAMGDVTMGVDCKCFSSRIDVKNVEMVFGLFEDVGVDIGLLVTTEGFTRAAVRRADAVRGMKLDIVPYEDLADWGPDLVWCHVCTDLNSDDFPGGAYLIKFDPENLPYGGELADAVGRCERCDSLHVKCQCGGVNVGYEASEGEWQECEGGCGTEWRFDEQRDRDGIPASSDPRDQVEFREGPTSQGV